MTGKTRYKGFYREITFHIGLRKTATTFLQKDFFPNLKDVNYIPKGDIFDELEKIRYEYLSEKDISEVREKIFDNIVDKKNLISYEGLAGDYFFSSSSSKERCSSKERIQILKDIKRIFPDVEVKIIVGIREQTDLLASLYKQYLQAGGYLQPEEFLNKLDFSKFKYNDLISDLDELFGRENIYIYHFENLVKNKEKTLREICNFIGESDLPDYTDNKRNIGYGEFQVKLARLLNRFLKTPKNQNGVLNLEIFESNILWWYSGPISRFLLQNNISYKIHYKKYTFPEHIKTRLKKEFHQ